MSKKLPFGSLGVRTCAEPGCGELLFSGTFCSKHSKQEKSGKHTGYLDLIDPTKQTPLRLDNPETTTCLEEGCTLVPFSKGRCRGHHQKFLYAGLSEEKKRERAKKIGDAHKGKPKPGPHNYWQGKTHSEETKAKMSTPILETTTNTEFPSLRGACAHYGFNMPTLIRALNSGKAILRGASKGLKFRYTNPQKIEMAKYRIKDSILQKFDTHLAKIIEINTEVSVVCNNGNTSITVEYPNGKTEKIDASWFLLNFKKVDQ